MEKPQVEKQLYDALKDLVEQVSPALQALVPVKKLDNYVELVSAQQQARTILRKYGSKRTEQLTRDIVFCEQPKVLACDGNCDKAWGYNTRPSRPVSDDPDDYVFLSDGELGVAPANPGTYEGGHGKPTSDQKLESKWCARQCERHVMVDPGEAVVLPDFSRRRYNKAPHVREDGTGS